jgi:hypothetical protein
MIISDSVFFDDPPFQHEGTYDHGDGAKMKARVRSIRDIIIGRNICTSERSASQHPTEDLPEDLPVQHCNLTACR